jgi:hypothetical protein
MMRKSIWALAALLAACATPATPPVTAAPPAALPTPVSAPPQAAAPPPVASPAAAVPDTKKAECVVIQAASEREGLAAEGKWLHEHFPGWKKVSQSLVMGAVEGQRFDEVDILDGAGEKHSVCFDITSFFGKM